MRAIVGLGNPGDDYAGTRHNAGFRVVERLASREGISLRSREARSQVGRGQIAGAPVILALPQTYMNSSGEAVRALCQKNGIDPPELCVVVDDIDLPLGTLRMRARGSAGGHQGLVSVISQIGSDFPRLRIGVRGEHYSREVDLADYVLAPLPKAERAPFEDAIERAIEALRLWVDTGIDAAMKRANTKPSSPDGASRPD